MPGDPDEFTVRTWTGQDKCPACQHVQADTFDPARHVHNCRRETPAEREVRVAVNARLGAERRAYEDALEAKYYGGSQ